MKSSVQFSLGLKRGVVGAFIGVFAGLVILFLLGLLQFFADFKEWQNKDLLEAMSRLFLTGVQMIVYNGMLYIPLCALIGILVATGKLSKSRA
jgi:hypothetical protein